MWMSGSLPSLTTMSTPRGAGTPSLRRDPSRAARLQRDAGLERGRIITKGIAIGSVAAVAVAGVYLSQALPGHAASPSSSTSGTTGVGASTPGPVGSVDATGSAASSQGSGISAPTSAPAPAYRQAPVVSGSS